MYRCISLLRLYRKTPATKLGFVVFVANSTKANEPLARKAFLKEVKEPRCQER
jgi:hypothetical protein